MYSLELPLKFHQMSGLATSLIKQFIKSLCDKAFVTLSFLDYKQDDNN